MHIRLLAIALVAIIATGCEYVRTTEDGDLPVAVWMSVPIEPAAPSAAHGAAREQTRDLVARILRDAGLHPTLDKDGVRVPSAEGQRARVILLADKRLIGSDVVVLLPARAGTCTRSSDGIVVPEGAVTP